MTTTLAFVRLMPSPPALVVSKNTPNSLSSLNREMLTPLSLDLTLPVSSSNLMPFIYRYIWMMSIIPLNWENTSILWFSCRYFSMNLSSKMSLPLVSSIF